MRWLEVNQFEFVYYAIEVEKLVSPALGMGMEALSDPLIFYKWYTIAGNLKMLTKITQIKTIITAMEHFI